MKLYDSELKVMDVLWREGELPARRVAETLEKAAGWNVNTSYTVIKKCIEKGAVERREPKFGCHALISRGEVQAYETEELIDRMFDGSKKQFFAAFLSEEHLTSDELQELKDMIDKMK